MSFPFYAHAIGVANFACRPLEPVDVAESAVYMLEQPLNRSVKALDVVPSGMYSSSTSAGLQLTLSSATIVDRV